MTLSRRDLLKATAAAGLVSLIPGVNVAFGADTAASTPGGQNVIVFLFLRFGMDGLSMIAPADDGAYRDRRPTIALRSAGLGAANSLGQYQGTPFFMHPRAGLLYEMFKKGSLAAIHASGVPTENRSHFETQEMVTRGLADNEVVDRRGWLARHLLSQSDTHSDFEGVSDGQGVTQALEGMGTSLTFSGLASLGYSFVGRYGAAMAAMHAGDGELAQSMQKTMRIADSVREKAASVPYETPKGNYTYGGLSNTLRPLAQVLKLDLGVRVATVDFGGWDHHEYLSNAFFNQAAELSDSVGAFVDDLGALSDRVTIVMMTEFGRRVRENTNNGTDHGAGAVMLVQGAGVNGGKFYGDWPGLTETVLDQGDLPVVTDYRRVLGELLVKRHAQTKLEQVFPITPYRPLGIFT